MPAKPTVVIAGAGLAGACAALTLAPTHSVVVLEAEHPAAGASGAAAGLVNPLMGRAANALPFAAEALAAFWDLVAAADARALIRRGVLRPAGSAKQARSFRRSAEAYPRLADWLALEACAEAFPDVPAPFGALHVTSGGAVNVPAFVGAVLSAAERLGAEVRTGARLDSWHRDGNGVVLETNVGAMRADRLVLALGYGLRQFSVWGAWGMHGVKGQVVRLPAPAPPLPLAGSGYVVPQGERVIVGSSYAHTFADLAPDAATSEAILAKATRLWPPLANATEEARAAGPIEAVAGVRVGVPAGMPGARLPRVEALADDLGGGDGRVWAFTGLGSRGLLLAPLYARRLLG